MVVDVTYITKEHSNSDHYTYEGVTGILAVQGAFAEHAAMLDALNAPWKLLRAADDYDETIERIILPGGESTTQGKLLVSTGLYEPIAAHIQQDKPVFGTCAGMILLAAHLDNDSNVYFGSLDATIHRNAYGRQLGSFATDADIHTYNIDGEEQGVISEFPLVFIRGPFVSQVGSQAHSMASVDNNVVALQQRRILATAFHPEITEDTRLHEYFLTL